MNRRYPFVFEGGPLDGHEIVAVRRTSIYRDETGQCLPVSSGDRKVIHEGGVYYVSSRPIRIPLGWRPGKYRWINPTARQEATR